MYIFIDIVSLSTDYRLKTKCDLAAYATVCVTFT